jgi:hypothetical protein
MEDRMTITKQEFNYGELTDDVRSTVREQAAAIHGLLERTTATIVEIGRRLDLVHVELGGTKFRRWISGEFAWSYSSAMNLLTAFQCGGAGRPNLVALGS